MLEGSDNFSQGLLQKGPTRSIEKFQTRGIARPIQDSGNRVLAIGHVSQHE